METSLLAKAETNQYFNKNFWKNFSIALSEGLLLFFFSFFYISCLSGIYEFTLSVVIFLSLLAFLFLFVFFIRSLVEESTSFLIYSSIADAIIIFLPFVFNFDFLSGGIAGYLLKNLLSTIIIGGLFIILLVALFALGSLRVRSVDNLYTKFSWHRIVKGSSFYLIISLSLFMAIIFLLYLFTGPGNILNAILESINSSIQSAVKIFVPKFDININLNDLAKAMHKETYFADLLAISFSNFFHTNIKATNKLGDILNIVFKKEFDSLKSNKTFIFGSGVVIFISIYSLLKIIEIILAFIGRILVEILVGLGFIRKTWIKVSKETIAF